MRTHKIAQAIGKLGRFRCHDDACDIRIVPGKSAGHCCRCLAEAKHCYRMPPRVRTVRSQRRIDESLRVERAESRSKNLSQSRLVHSGTLPVGRNIHG